MALNPAKSISGSERPEAESSPTSRRDFLARTLGAGSGLFVLGGTAACAREEAREEVRPTEGGEPTELPIGKDPDDFVLHTTNPMTLETKRSAFGTSGIVPVELLFVRNNLPTPAADFVADPDRWELSVEGVAQPRTISVGELKELGLESFAMVLQCSGNGRAFFPTQPSGSKWGVGAAGCVAWSGVPVRTVIEALGGALPEARYLTGTGGEVLPEGIDPLDLVVERSIPLEKGLDDALLAWQLNGQPIPLIHGGPLRLIVPGYYGVNQIKYIKRLALTPEQTEAAIMRTGYRVRPIGEAGGPDQPTMWEMGVKSWINHPSPDGPRPAGRFVIDGVAFAGGERIASVEVSLDGGQSWQPAPLIGPELGRYAWRQFALPVSLAPGRHILASRATDAAGNVQPEERQENERGYGNRSWRDHAVEITLT